MSINRTIHYQLNGWVIAITAVSLLLVAGAGYAWHAQQLHRLASALLMRADQLEQQAQYEEAVGCIRRYLLLQPEDATARARLASASDRAGTDGYRTVRYYYQAIGLAPERVDLRQRLADLLLSLQRWPEASSEAQQVLSANPNDPLALRIQALAKYQLAVDDLHTKWDELGGSLALALSANPTDVELAANLALVDREHIDPPMPAEADRIMDQLVEDNHRAANALLARAEYRRRFNLAGADDDLDAALEAAPKDLRVVTAAAERDCSRQQWDAAVARYQLMTEIAPQDRRGYLGLGLVYRRQSELDRAATAWQQGLEKVGPDDLILGWQLAQLWIDQYKLTHDGHKLKQADEQLRTLSSAADKLRLDTPSRIVQAVGNANDYLRAQWWLAQDKPLAAIPILKRLAVVEDAFSERTPLRISQVDVKWQLAGAWGRIGRWDQAALAYEDVIAIRPADSVPRLAAAKAWLNAGQLTEALKDFRVVVTQPPVAVEAWLPYTQALYRQQLRLPATERDWREFDKALNQVPSSGAAAWQLLLMRADYDLITNRRDEAMALCEQVEHQFIGEEGCLQALALAYQHGGVPDAADRILSHLDQIAKSALVPLMTRVEILAQRGEDSQVIEVLESARQIFHEPDLSTVEQRLAEQYIRLGKLTEGRKILTALTERHPDQLQFIQELATVALETGDTAAAESCEEKLLQLEGDDGSVWRYVRARRLLDAPAASRAALLAEAEYLATELQSRRPSWPDTYLLLGLLAEQQGRSVQAVAAYRRALALGDRRLQVSERLVALLSRTQQFDQAWQVLNDVQQRSGGSDVLSGLAIALSLKTSEIDRALELASDLVKRRPNDPLAQIWLGQSEQLANHLDPAEKAFQRATELAPHELRTWQSLFQFYVKIHNLTKAREALGQLGALVTQTDIERASRLAAGYELLGDLPLAVQYCQQALQLAPDNTAVQQQLASLLLRSHDPAIGKLLEQMERSAKTGEARRNVALLLAARNDAAAWEKCWQLLDSSAETDAGEAAADNRVRALLLTRRGRADDRPQAIALLLPLVDNPRVSQPADRLLLAQLQEAEGNLAEARRQLEMLLTQPQSSTGPLAIYVDFLLRNQLADEAETWLKKLEAAAPDEWLTTVLRADWLARQKRTAEIESLVERAAIKGIAKCISDRQKAQFAVQVGQLYSNVGLTAQAIRYGRQAYQISDEFYAPLVTALVAGKQIGEAVQICDEIVKKNPNSQPARALAGALIASESESGAIAGEADSFLTRALQQYPEDDELLIAISGVRYLQGRMDAVCQLSRQVLARQPNNSVALNNLAALLAEQSGHEAEAMTLIERALAQEAHNPTLLDTKGMILFHQGKWEEAAALLDQALTKPTRDPRMRFHRALVHLRLNDHSQAQNCLAEARAAGLTPAALTPTEQKLLTELEQQLAEPAAERNPQLSAR